MFPTFRTEHGGRAPIAIPSFTMHVANGLYIALQQDPNPWSLVCPPNPPGSLPALLFDRMAQKSPRNPGVGMERHLNAKAAVQCLS